MKPRRHRIAELLTHPVDGAPVTVTGWVRTSRFGKNISFVHLFDGSCANTIQAVLTTEQAEAHAADLGVGSAVEITGRWKASPGGKQAFEVAAEQVRVIGRCDPSDYPLQKKRTSMEHLRTIAHLRPRTNTFQSLFRVRHSMSWHIHRFFHERGFLWIHTPILTTSDTEGAGELFEVRAGEPGDPPFFGQPAFLTVSGQLSVENFAQAFTDVYTFGPTFRAEHSHTSRHAAEFWMVEPEIAFANLDDVVDLAEAFVKEVATAVMRDCADDMAFFDQRIQPGLLDSLRASLQEPFARVTWHEARALLASSGVGFEHPVDAEDFELQTEHERWLAEEHFQRPVFVTHYPAHQKAFYMRLDDEPTEGVATVAATDLLVPRIGELIGGSQREERLHVLDERIAAFGLDPAPYWWYRDLRRYGSVPHGGFGLGLERFLMWITGMQNIRDVLPFPRTPGSAEF